MESNVKLYAQYTNSEKLKTLLNALMEDSWLDFEATFLEKYNLFTCDNWGLQWWGNRNMLDMPQYIFISNPDRNITTNVMDDVYFSKFLTPNNFNNGNWYSNQTSVEYFEDEEYRTILINKYKQTYYACTLGNLYEFLNSFFKNLPDTDPKRSIVFKITVERRMFKGKPMPSFWHITYSHDFDTDARKNSMWEALFTQQTVTGNSVIMPIPNDVEWNVKKEGT